MNEKTKELAKELFKKNKTIEALKVLNNYVLELLEKDLKPSTIQSILEKELNVKINYNTFYKALKKINKKQKGEKNA